MGSIPEISVITATFNDGLFLSQAVESMLNQTFTNFEYIIIDDASTDQTPQILTKYAAKDTRILVFRNERNMGRSIARNQALKFARGKWIAIFDGDDISHPKRLETQLDYLKDNPEIDYLGTDAKYINKHTDELMPEKEFNLPKTHGVISWHLCFDYPFHHTSTMGRRHLFLDVGGYPTEYPVCEDIFLWMEMSKFGARFANLDEKLIVYRVNTKPKHYALNQILAKQLHRKYFSDTLNENTSEKVFDIIWQTNAQQVYLLGSNAYTTYSIEAIEKLTSLFHKFVSQKILNNQENKMTQINLLTRIRKIIDLNDPSNDFYQPTYQYTYHLVKLTNYT